MKTGTDGSVDGAEENGETDVGPVPHVVVVDGGHAQKHEDNGFWRTGQHFHGVLQSGLRVGGNIALNIIFASNAAECDAEKNERKIII